jgi:hypothetical protein
MTRSYRSAWPLAVLGIVIVLVGSLLFVFWRIETWPARTAAGISGVFQDAFQFDPRITVDNDVVVEQSTNIAELAVVENTVVVERGYENRWLFSTKRMRARATYAVKSGYDLSHGVDVRVAHDPDVVTVTFPEPKLLSLDQQDLEILEWDNGLWNRLDAADAEEAVDGVRELARERAVAQGVLDEAKASVVDQLSSRLAEETGFGVNVKFRTTD